MSLAPIVLFVYNRPWHTKQTIEALLKNTLASESELVIYSDAAKNETAEQAVKEVRKYIHSINDFKTITVVERDKNMGLADSIIDGVTSIVKRYGKVIVLEDDLVTSPYFLKFMNDALVAYQSEEKVFTVSGYSGLKIPFEDERSLYLSHISSSWGWGTWSKEWNTIEWDKGFCFEILRNKKLLKGFEAKIGNNRIRMLKKQTQGKINSWAIRRLFNQLIQDKMTVFPRLSYVRNIGHDGSGVHCGVDTSFDIALNTAITNMELVHESELINKLVYVDNHDRFFERMLSTFNRLCSRLCDIFVR